MARLLYAIMLGFIVSYTSFCNAEGAPPTAPSAPESKSSVSPSALNPSTPTPPGSREYHLKAAFLRYVAKYIEWPKDSIKEGHINLCVLGQVPYFEGLNSINGKEVNDLTINISKILSMDDAKQCQLVFIAKTEDDSVKKIVEQIGHNPILGFGDMEGYAEQGGQMNFYIANNRLAIMVNLPPIEQANLKVNPQMLRLVTIVPSADLLKPATTPAKSG